MTVAGSEAEARSRRVLGAWGKSLSQDKVLPPKGCSGEMGRWYDMCLGAAFQNWGLGGSLCFGTSESEMPHDITGVMVLQTT